MSFVRGFDSMGENSLPIKLDFDEWCNIKNELKSNLSKQALNKLEKSLKSNFSWDLESFNSAIKCFDNSDTWTSLDRKLE